MADTPRPRADILSILADNTGGDISPQDLRDFVVSVMRNVTTAAGATHSLAAGDAVVHSTYSATGAVTVTLTTAQTLVDREVTIKDAGGNASVNNITIATEGAQTIDGAATATISTDYGATTLYSDGSNWFTK